MFHLGEFTARTCAGLTRRQALQLGGLSLLGLNLPQVLAAEGPSSRARPLACVFLWLDGGPSHFETFDPKPATPDTVRGPYGAIRTRVPGVHFSELLPQLANQMDRLAIIRSMTHGVDSHAPIPMLTGFTGETTAYGAVVTKLLGHAGDMPPYVHLGNNLGVGGGRLGASCDPIVVADPSGKKVDLPQFSLSANITADRFKQREELLAAVDRMRAVSESNPSLDRMDVFYRRAISMLTSPRVREAFDLAREAEDTRERYGAHFFGQSCLQARRLVEAGTRFVQIRWFDQPAFHGWDVHGADLGGMVRMEQHLCPRLDQSLSMLLEDLRQRGLLDTTLVIATGEFGRTPKINKYGARDHWPHCFSVLLAGAGIPGGTIVGASDREGAYPAHDPVRPPELAATIYRRLGIDTNTDVRVKPFLQNAAPVAALV